MVCFHVITGRAGLYTQVHEGQKGLRKACGGRMISSHELLHWEDGISNDKFGIQSTLQSVL